MGNGLTPQSLMGSVKKPAVSTEVSQVLSDSDHQQDGEVGTLG